MKPLRIGVARRLLHHKQWYNTQLRPLLQSFHPNVLRACRFVPPSLLPLLRPNGEFLTMEAALRRSLDAGPSGAASEGAVQTPRPGRTGSAPVDAGLSAVDLGLEALGRLEHLRKRLAWLEKTHTDVGDVRYALRVGDVVRHTQLGHVGVVAARLPCCPENDAWIVENLTSVDDERMSHPWYLILVAHHEGIPLDFVRYGSQLTHEKILAGPSIGFHRLLPMYFKGFDADKGVYVPKGSHGAFPADLRSFGNEDVVLTRGRFPSAVAVPQTTQNKDSATL